MIPIENLMNPRALDFHAQSNFIYFADATSYLIGRQKIDGTERDIILKEGSEMFIITYCTSLPLGCCSCGYDALLCSLPFLRYSHC